jgi:hypothetical protein
MKIISHLLVGIFLVLPNTSALAAQAKLIVGRVEKVRIYPGNLVIRAKMDTGAKTSSLGCHDMSLFERDGEKWVRFRVTNHKEETITLEQRVYRISKIKRGFWKTEQRVVIKLGVCLGNVYEETEVNLVDRSGFNYKMLIGRSLMAGNFIIDPSLKYTTEPSCKGVSGK